MAVEWKKILFSGDVTASDLAAQAANTTLANATGGAAKPTAVDQAGMRTLLNVEDGADVTDTTNVKAALNADLGGDITIGTQSDDKVTFGGDIQLGGNDIKSSGGTTALSVSGANVTVAGNLTVSGTQITTATETLQINDNKLVLNADLPGQTAEPGGGTGIVVNRGSSTSNKVGSGSSNHWVIKQLDGRFRIGESTDGTMSGGNYVEHGMIIPKIEKAGAPTTEKAGGPNHGFCVDTTNSKLYWRVADVSS